MIAQTLLSDSLTEPSIQTVLRAIRIRIRLRISDECKIKVSLPSGMAEVPPWLKQAKEENEWAFGLAVALVAALELPQALEIRNWRPWEKANRPQGSEEGNLPS